MAIDITTLSPAVLKAKNVATESYVNTSTANLANKDMSNVTTIDGGKITTGKVQSADTNTYFDLSNNQIKMNNGSFILNSTAAGTINDPNIQGAYIKGAYIKGATVEASTFLGDLLKTTIYDNASAPAPSTGAATTIVSFTLDAPTVGEAHRLYITASLQVKGGNWDQVYFDLRVDGVSLLGFKSPNFSLGSVMPFFKTYLTGSKYSTSTVISVVAYQRSGGFAYAYTSTDVNIAVIGVA